MGSSNRTTAHRRFHIDVTNYRTAGMLALILILVAGVSARNPHFLDASNLRVIFMDTAILGIAASGLLAVMLTGNIDVSSSSVIAVAGFSSALLVKTFPALNPVLVLGTAIALGLVMGAVNGVIIGYGGVPSIIVTLGTLSVYRGINYIISGGGWVVSRDLPPTFRLIANGTLFSVPYLIYIFIFVVIILFFVLNFTRAGRSIYAAGSNPAHARLMGMNLKRIVFSVFALSGTLFGLSGVLWVSRFNFAQSNTASGFELTVIAATVIGGTSVNGGRGTVEGVVLGAFLLSFIINAINVVKISPFWKMAIQGIIILAAVIFDSWLIRREKR